MFLINQTLFHVFCLYFVASVAAKVRGSELHVALQRENTDSVATLCCVLLSDVVHACPIWKRD